MSEFRLLTYSSEAGPRAGLLVKDSVLDVAAATQWYFRQASGEATFSADSVLSILQAWPQAQPVLADLAERFAQAALTAEGDVSRPLADVRLQAPILYPGAIYCAAANYTDHMKEMNGREPPDKQTTRPYFFLKTPIHSVIGHEDAIRLPETSLQIDWEAEIGVVIGRAASRASIDEALSYVAGYTIINDLSVRDATKRTDWNFGNDWFRGKCFDTSAPMGPWLTPAEQIKDPHDLAIQLWVNDQLMQDSSSSFMHFSIPEQIAYLSEQITLRPGDVIATGTPSGVGRPRGIYLKPGDNITIKIAGLGTLKNRVVSGRQSSARALSQVAE